MQRKVDGGAEGGSGRWGGADDRGPWGMERDERRHNVPVSHHIAVVATGQAARRHGEGGIEIMDPGEPTACRRNSLIDDPKIIAPSVVHISNCMYYRLFDFFFVQNM